MISNKNEKIKSIDSGANERDAYDRPAAVILWELMTWR